MDSHPPANLLGYDLQGLTTFLAGIGEKPFRARQLMRWVHHFGESDFEQMTDLAKSLRASAGPHGRGRRPRRLLADSVAADGTRKWLLEVGAGNGIETVFIPEVSRGTLCISSQVGCALECAFCATGRQGFNRNLTVAEIIGQLWWANRALGRDARADKATGDRIISNVVMMGMGEPLTNFDNVVTALRIMLDDHAYGLSRRRVTVSTAGVVPNIDRLRQECPVALAVSLHAPNDELRDRLVPINRKWPLRELLAACGRYLDSAPRRRRRRAPAPSWPGEMAAAGCAARLHHLRVRHAGGRERSSGACAPAPRHCAPGPLQVQPDSLQSVPRLRLRALRARGGPPLPGDSDARRADRDGAQDPRRGHRRGLRTARRAGAGSHAPGAAPAQPRPRHEARTCAGAGRRRSRSRGCGGADPRSSRVQPAQSASTSALERAKIHTELGVGYYESRQARRRAGGVERGDLCGQDLRARLERARAGAHGPQGGRPGGERLQAGAQARSHQLGDQEQLRPVPVPAQPRQGRRALPARRDQEPALHHARCGLQERRIVLAATWATREAAEEFFLRALKLNPNQPQALYNMAELEYGRGRYAAAKQYLDRYVKAVPALGPEALLLGARIERRLGDRTAMLAYGNQLRLRYPFGAGDQGLSRRTLLMSSQEPDNSGLIGTPCWSAERSRPSRDASGGRPGAQLLAERRAQGLSLGDVARQLKLSVRQVEALERDEYAAFPAPVFVRGFLRNYAKLLQLDPDALVAQAAITAAPPRAASRLRAADARAAAGVGQRAAGAGSVSGRWRWGWY